MKFIENMMGGVSGFPLGPSEATSRVLFVFSSGLHSSRKTRTYRRGSSRGRKDDEGSGVSLLRGETVTAGSV